MCTCKAQVVAAGLPSAARITGPVKNFWTGISIVCRYKRTLGGLLLLSLGHIQVLFMT